MATKQYTSVTTTQTARPRSKRLRLLGGTVAAAAGTTSGSQTVLSNPSNQTGHTHDNKSDLDRITFDANDYLLVQDATEKSKVKAGYADEAGNAAKATEADHATKADNADEATHATNADKATEADHSAEADHAAKADEATNADKWDGKDFADYLDQPVRQSDSVQFGSVTSNRVVSKNYNSGETDGTGWGLTVDTETGKSRLEVDNLLVRMKAVFQELEIRKRTYTGGNVILSGAGSQIAAVVRLNKDGLLLSGLNLFTDSTGNYIYIGNSFLAVGADKIASSDDSQDVYNYRCYILADDGTTRTRNWWQAGDQAICQTFNIEEGHYDGVQNRYYWRLVTGVSGEAVQLDDGTYYDYVDLAAQKTVDFKIGDTTYTGEQGYDTSVLTDGNGNVSTTSENVWADTPQKGDQIVQLGNRKDTERQNAITIDTTGTGAPSIKEYAGISTFSLSGHLRTQLSPAGNLFLAEYFKIIATSDDEVGTSLAQYINSNVDFSDINTKFADINEKFDTVDGQLITLDTSINDPESGLETKASNNATAAAEAKAAADNAQSTANTANDAAKTAQETANEAQSNVENVNTSLVNFKDGYNNILSTTFGVEVDDNGNMVGTPALKVTTGLVTQPTGSGLIYYDKENNKQGTVGVTETKDGETVVYLTADNIRLNGYATVNNRFTIDENGYMSATGAKISGDIEATSGTFNGYLRSSVWSDLDEDFTYITKNSTRYVLVSERLNLLLSSNDTTVLLPCDPEFIGARVLIVSGGGTYDDDGGIPSGTTPTTVTIKAGRHFQNHAYINYVNNGGALTGSEDDITQNDPKTSALNDTNTYPYAVKQVFAGAQWFLGAWNTDGKKFADTLKISGGSIELLGVPSLAKGMIAKYKYPITDGLLSPTYDGDGHPESLKNETTSEAVEDGNFKGYDTVQTLCQWVVVGVQGRSYEVTNEET